MIRGHKPSSYFATATGDGYKIEGEGRQCVHCGFTWEYHPGSGITRGYCLKHDGFLCARPECAADQRRLLAAFPDKSLTCITLEDWNDYRRDQYARDPRFEVLPSGIVVQRDY